MCLSEVGNKGNRLAIPTPVAIGVGDRVEVAIPGLDNPAGTGLHVLTVATSPNSTSSVGFRTVPAGSIGGLSVSRSNNGPAATAVTYTIDFTTSVTGALAENTGTITVQAAAGTFPPPPSCSDATATVTDLTTNVSDTTASICFSEVGTKGNRVVIPSPVAIGSHDRVEVAIPGLDNPARIGAQTLTVQWLVDPIDGTANFIAGSPDWAVMVALVERGLTVASWIWRPVGQVMYIAETGNGATRNGLPLAHPGSPREPAEMRGAVLARFLDEGTAALVANNACQFRSVLPGRMCAGAEYPAVVEDEQDFALFWRTLPWDHAPGALLANEAGLSARRPDGSAYEPGRPGTGLLVAAGEANWQTVRGALLGPRPPTNSGRPADVNC